MRRVALIVAVLAAGCTAPSDGAVRSQPPGTAPSEPVAVATAAATRMPSSVVKMTVNGKTAPVSEPVRATGDLPTVVVLAFPFAVDKAGVDQWLPRGATKTWRDDATLELSFPTAESAIGFKVPETRAAAGGATIDWFTVDINFPGVRLIRIYTIADLLARNVPEPSVAVRAPPGDGLTLSDDGKTAIVHDGFSPDSGPRPTLLDLATGATTPLADPANEHWLSFAGWLPDGLIAFVGRDVWVGENDGTGVRRIADAQGAINGYPWVAVPDPAGRRIALWGYNQDGRIAVVDLTTGAITRLTGPFRRPCEDCGISLAWSRDGTLIAGLDSDHGTGPSLNRVRVVDVAGDRTVRTLEDVRGFVPFDDDEFMVIRPSGEQGAGGRNLGTRMGFDLVETARYLGCGWRPSPTGRYLLQHECGGAGKDGYTLIDTQTGRTHSFGLDGPSEVRWLDGDRLAAVLYSTAGL